MCQTLVQSIFDKILMKLYKEEKHKCELEFILFKCISLQKKRQFRTDFEPSENSDRIRMDFRSIFHG